MKTTRKAPIQNAFSQKKNKGKLSLETLAYLLLCIALLIMFSGIYYIYSSLDSAYQSSSETNVMSITSPKTNNNEYISQEGSINKSNGVITQDIKSNNVGDNKIINVDVLTETLDKIERDFYDRYGGKQDAISILKDGIQSVDNKSWLSDTSTNVQHLSNRIFHSIANKNPFIISFAGYSVTVGRGNHFEQSYPFIMRDILLPLFNNVGIELQVKNSAIGGIPSFPYGFCLKNFLGSNSDVVSWDFGMNEGNDAKGLESYFRHAMTSLDKNPMFIVLDNKPPRKKLIQEYAKKGYAPDSIFLDRDKMTKSETAKKLISSPSPPKGFKDWDVWGSPKGAPGQSPWHPKLKEHEMMGWAIAMYFVEAFKYIVENSHTFSSETTVKNKKLTSLPEPVYKDNSDHSAVTIGVPNSDNSNEWHMSHTSCRTSFKPNMSGPLSDIITSGLSPEANSPENVMTDHKEEDFEKGWLVDVGTVEKKTKRKVESFGGMGYIDMKIAIYGTSKSGTLEMWLPYEEDEDSQNVNQSKKSLRSIDTTRANQYFKSLILCEVNEKRGNDECNFSQDLHIEIGGAKVTSVSKMNAAAYLKKQICIHVEIPYEAQISKHPLTASSYNNEDPFLNFEGKTDIGLEVKVSVSNENVSFENGACSISHVVWTN